MKYFKKIIEKYTIDEKEEIHVPELVINMKILKRILKEKGYSIERK